MKWLLLSLFFAPLILTAQPSDSVLPRSPVHPEVRVYLKGHAYESMMEASFFRNNFQLAATDSSYSIEKFSVTWVNSEGDIHERLVYGPTVLIEGNLTGLEKLPLNEFVAFDNIHIMKEGKLYKSPSFIIKIKDSASVEKHKQGLAKCHLMLAPYGQQNSFSASIFREDIPLKLSDPKYKILSFELTFTDENGDLLRTNYGGPAIIVNHDRIAALLRDLPPGSVVMMEKIKVGKEGKVYRMADIPIYIK